MSDKTMPITGGCLCGAVRFEATAPPSYVGYCHCRMCQKSTGHTSAIFVMFTGEDRSDDAGTLRFTKGEPTYYRSSAWMERAFCPNCGSPLGVRSKKGHRSVMAGTLDHPEDWPPNEGHSGIESKVPWDRIHDDLPQWRTEDDPDYDVMTKSSN